MSYEEPSLEIVFIPSLVEMLTFLERDKGSDLDEGEVINLINRAVCMTINSKALEEIEKERGYKDIDPENCWEEWCSYKDKLTMV